MPEQFDFKSEWEKTKKQLAKFSKEAVIAAKKGEEEFVKFSKQSKLHIDSTTASLKKEQLFHLIGKEYAGLKDPSQPSAKLGRLIDDLRKVESQQESLKVRIKQGQKRQSSPK